MIRITFLTVCSLSLLAGCDWSQKPENAPTQEPMISEQEEIQMYESPADTNLGTPDDQMPHTLADDNDLD